MIDLHPEWCLARARESVQGMQGYYNANIRVDTAEGPVLVRIPRERADQMDLRIWPEADVIRAVEPHIRAVPRLLHVGENPPFQVHEFINGVQLNEVYPRGKRLPPHVVELVVRMFADLRSVPLRTLPALPRGWPADGDTAAFALLLDDFTRGIHAEHEPRYGALFRALGIPADPFRAVEPPRAGVERAFRLLHADVHRQNIMLREPEDVVFLDWELALWGDPLYELAVHLHKMGYLAEERDALVAAWGARYRLSTDDSADLDRYAAHEKVKSAVVDSIRYSQEIVRPDTPTGRRASLAAKLAEKLAAADTVWAGAPDHAGVASDPRQVLHTVSRWSPDAPG